jgi:hypothetical protein
VGLGPKTNSQFKFGKVEAILSKLARTGINLTLEDELHELKGSLSEYMNIKFKVPGPILLEKYILIAIREYHFSGLISGANILSKKYMGPITSYI